MVICKKCGKTYDEQTVACFASAGIPLEGLRCRVCADGTLVRTQTTGRGEDDDGL